jgi:glycosyltransferase involved in cell wall biosynthesis
MKKEVSLVLTIHGNDSDLHEMLISIQNQTMLPIEVIIINSLYRIDESLILQNFKKHLNIKYYFYKNRMFPGASRNKGVEKSSFPLIAFLDSKTVPKKSWLENSYTQLSKLNSQIVFGCTKYKASTEIQKILLIST